MCCQLLVHDCRPIRSCWCVIVCQVQVNLWKLRWRKFAWKIRGRKSCEKHTLLLLFRDKYWIIFKKVFAILELFASNENNFISKCNFSALKRIINYIINYRWILLRIVSLDLFKRFLKIILIRFLINFQLTSYFHVKNDPKNFERSILFSIILDLKKKIK